MNYDNSNTGILSRNERRENDKHPEFTGTINIDGTDYWLSAWVRERKDGSGKFFSLAAKPKDQRQPKAAQKPVKQAPKATMDDLDESVPF